MKNHSLDMQFTTIAPLITALALKPPTDTEKQIIKLQAAALEAMTAIEQGHQQEAWKTLRVALQEAA